MNLAINLAVNPWIAAAVFAATAVTDAAYVFFNAAVGARHRIRAANWSAVWYMPLRLLGDQLHGEPGLRYIRRRGFVVRRLRVGDLAHSRTAGAGADAT
jgi:hypothetical protein